MKPDTDAQPVLDRPPSLDPANSLRLHRAGVAGVIALAVYFLYRTQGDVDALTLVGLAIFLLAAMPILSWAKNSRAWFPAFELFCLTTAAFYAFPLLLRHHELQIYPDGIIVEAGLLVVMFLGAAHLGFGIVRNPGRPSRWASTSLLPEFSYRYIPVGMFLNTLHLYVESHTRLIPANTEGTFRALFFGIGTLSTFVLAKLWGFDALDRRTRIFFIINLSVQIVLLFSHLYLITGISLLALALIAFSSARRRVPWIVLAVLLPLIAILHQGKSDMRARHWGEGKHTPEVSELPAFFTEWISTGLSPADDADKGAKRATIFERASLIQMLCLSVDRVPSLKPYLDGESYVDIPAQIIPRFLWPNKPSSLLANVRLGIHFGLVDPANPFQFSIAFGMLAEAYVNFGWAGVGMLGFALGLGFRRVSELSLGAAQFSTLGILMILLTAWSFQAEQVLATWLTSLFQAAAVCIGVPLIYRQFTTR